MKGPLVHSLRLAAGAAFLGAHSLVAAEVTPVSLRYAFAPGQTNAYRLQIEAQGEAGREAIEGTFVVSSRWVGTNLLGLTIRGQLRPQPPAVLVPAREFHRSLMPYRTQRFSRSGSTGRSSDRLAFTAPPAG